MKKLIFATMLSVGGMAMAQTAPDTSTPDTTATQPDMTSQPSGMTTSDPSQNTGPAGVTQQGTVPNGTAMAPAGTNEPPMAAPGDTVVPAANQSQAFTPQAATGDYPNCSKTVTDHCVQAYEKGVLHRPHR